MLLGALAMLLPLGVSECRLQIHCDLDQEKAVKDEWMDGWMKKLINEWKEIWDWIAWNVPASQPFPSFYH